MDISNYYLADFIARRKHPLHLVSHNVDPALLSYPNVIWHRAPRPFGSNLIGERILRWIGFRVAARKELASNNAIVNGGNCPLPGVNWVHFLHAAAPPPAAAGALQTWRLRQYHRSFLSDEAKALRCARIVIANSQRTKDDLIEHYGMPQDRVHLVYYGSNPELFYPANDATRRHLRDTLGLPRNKFLVAFVGALGDRRKGFDTLFAAWQAGGRKFLEASELVVVGHGAELPLWQRRAAELPRGSSIRFLGFRRDVPDILRACDAFVAPARYEAFGLSVLEALCCGLPAVVARDAGVAERFPPALRELLIEDTESVGELTAKLHLLQNQRGKFREQCLRLASEMQAYTWDDMASSIYAKITGREN
jgi:glycosyltransferase involved in cell wall biosynthesis